jgi:hypothetical protein
VADIAQNFAYGPRRASTKRYANPVAAAPHHLAVPFGRRAVPDQQIKYLWHADRRHHLQAGTLFRDVAHSAINYGGVSQSDLRRLEDAMSEPVPKICGSVTTHGYHTEAT